MALDPLPDEIIVRDRADYISGMAAAYLTKRPNDKIPEGSFQLAIFAAVADQVGVPQSLNARTIGRSIPLSSVVGIRLDQRLAELQLPERFRQSGATGYVVVQTSFGGADISEGDLLTEDATKSTFEAAASGHVDDGDPFPIRAVSTGPSTNFAAGTTLTWSSPPIGLAPTATVQESTGGKGLTGGRLAEGDEQVRLRISDAEADPAAAGNGATYRQLAENSGAHGVPVQKAFTFHSPQGAGTIGLAFLLTPGGPGTSRIASPAQIALVREYILTVPEDESRIPPGDDFLFDTTILPDPVSIVLDMRWSQSGAGWKDTARWPVRHAAGDGAIVVSAATDATHFTLARDAGSYVGEAQPAAGQTIALYDVSTGTFSRKRILSFTGTGPWVITVDTTNNASDTSYVPVVGQRACPWSNSLDDLATPILDYFNSLGPGEQFDEVDLFDPGTRLRRMPPSPEKWPSAITNHLVTSILDVPAVANAIVQEGLGRQATVGVPGTTAYLLELGDIAVFPL